MQTELPCERSYIEIQAGDAVHLYIPKHNSGFTHSLLTQMVLGFLHARGSYLLDALYCTGDPTFCLTVMLGRPVGTKPSDPIKIKSVPFTYEMTSHKAYYMLFGY